MITFAEYVIRNVTEDLAERNLQYDIEVNMTIDVNTIEDVMTQLWALRRAPAAFIAAAELYAEYIREQNEG